MRRLLPAALMLVLACGEGSAPAEPTTGTYPAVKGTYAISGTFDDLTSDASYFQGTVTFSQGSRESPRLTGSIDMTVTLPNGSFSLRNVLHSASVTPEGGLQFTYQDPYEQWGFYGSVTGDDATGRHVLSSPSLEGTFQGNWSLHK